jgi:hypothetical protein
LGKRRKLYERITGGQSDKNIPFDQARSLLLHLGFKETIRGSHHKFEREGVTELINLQEIEGGKCKPYQVRQMRSVLAGYNLKEEL